MESYNIKFSCSHNIISIVNFQKKWMKMKHDCEFYLYAFQKYCEDYHEHWGMLGLFFHPWHHGPWQPVCVTEQRFEQRAKVEKYTKIPANPGYQCEESPYLWVVSYSIHNFTSFWLVLGPFPSFLLTSSTTLYFTQHSRLLLFVMGHKYHKWLSFTQEKICFSLWTYSICKGLIHGFF